MLSIFWREDHPVSTKCFRMFASLANAHRFHVVKINHGQLAPKFSISPQLKIAHSHYTLTILSVPIVENYSSLPLCKNEYLFLS